MKTRRLLKASRLAELGACKEQVRLFRRLWGKQVYVTVPRMVAVADKFSWDWAAEYLLSAPAWAEYYRVRAAASAEYDRVTAPASAEYDRVRAAASAEYYRVTAAAWAECYRVRAAAWATAYIQDGQK